MLEYLEPAVKNGLQDSHGYVRKAAVIACVKMFHINPVTVRESSEIIDRLYGLVADADVHVSMNSIYVLDEVMEDAGGKRTIEV
jgi:vesicle coat complex subunit